MKTWIEMKQKKFIVDALPETKLDLSQTEITWTLKRQNKTQVNVLINCPRVHQVTKKE